ncbi:RNA polymerase sigma factor [Lewinella sp. LCG006]|uniref:RNA polymerase sigma factor n=1 Tax=Lewinella sp. LCG006 TaxID=3231911 RepID=UPI003460A2B6
MSNNSQTLLINDQEILQFLQSNRSNEQDEGLRALYQLHYGMIEQLVLRNNGEREDAADIFQDGLVALFHKSRQTGFVLTASLKTLLYAICRNLWLMKLRKKKRETPLTDVHQETVSLDAGILDLLEDNDRNQLIAQGLQQLGSDCQKVLQLYYFERSKMKDIADTMGYAGEQVAKNKKSRCLRKLREWVLAQPVAKEVWG